MVACVPAADLDDVTRRAAAAGVEVVALGTAGGDRLRVRGLVDVALADAVGAWTGALPRKLQAVDS